MICVNDLDMGQTRSIQNLQSNLVLQRDEVEDKAVLAKQACPSIRCVSISGCWVGVVIAVRLLILQPPDNPISSKCFPSLMAAAGKTMEGVVAILFGSWCPGILGVIPYPNFFKCICTSVFVPLCTLFLYLNFYTCICFFVFVSWH